MVRNLTFDGSYTNEIANRVRLSNKIQQLQRSASVSPIAEQVEIAGPQTSFGSLKSRVLTTLKTDMEALIGVTMYKPMELLP